jgi:D-ribulokinase
MLVMGIDVGTQGVRALIVDVEGKVRAEADVPFAGQELRSSRPGWFEQDPRLWREALYAAVGRALADLEQSAEEIAALSVTSTSGTLCLTDADGEPLGPAIMYSDMRCADEAAEAQAAGADLAEKLGSQIGASWALSKLLWVARHEPERLAQARWATSPTDLVIGWLTGRWGRIDWTNALKWAYDVVDLRWPTFITDALGLPARLLPEVDAPGTPVGSVSPLAAEATGLSTRTLVVAGATDGNASQFASGAVAPGDWNSTLGTTLVLKGVTTALLRDPLGRVYCHRHPDSGAVGAGGDSALWLPGGASSSGADSIAQRFAAEDLPRLNAAAQAMAPTDLTVYPLMRRGERFPFHAPDAEGFILGGETADEATLFRGYLEGLAYVERLSYDTVEALGAPVGDTIYAVGGATRSDAGVQIRANVLGRVLAVPVTPLGAMGAAVLAARGCAFSSVAEAAGAMVHIGQRVEPQAEQAAAYQERYARFLDACRQRGYLP